MPLSGKYYAIIGPYVCDLVKNSVDKTKPMQLSLV